MLYYFDFQNYFKMVGLAWNETVPRARAYYLAVLCLAVPIVSTFHAICFFLDGIFFPGVLRVEVREPVFLVGHARSGTTLTHRLLSKDEGRFSSFRLYELYFPSLLQKKIIRLAAAFDERLLGGFLEKRVRRWETWRYAAGRDAHRMGLTEPEEDDILFYYSMASGFWITKMPYMGDLDFYHVNDWPEAKRRRLFDFYRDCVRRQLVLNGPEKIHLSKNPIFAGRVASILESFPDAKIVVNVRNPNETIPSLLKLVRGGWKTLGWDEARQDRCLRILTDQSWHSYLHPLEVLDANPETNAAVVDYRDLVSDPVATIEQVYQDLALPMTDAYRELLLGEGKREGRHQTSHTYSLEEFGLEADEIRSQLAELFDRFQWDADAPLTASPREASHGSLQKKETP